MAQSDILKACNAILNNSPAFPVAWENGQTDQVDMSGGKITHYQQSFIPSETGIVSIAFNGSQNLSGIYQVLIAIPKNKGVADSVTGEVDLLAKFARGTQLNFEVQIAEVETVSIGAGFEDGEWRIIPCSINYRGFANG